MLRSFHSLLPLVPLLLLPLAGMAHPLPDIPITSTFGAGGKCTVHAVVDPRCFDADPNMAPYLLNKELAAMAPEKQAALKEKVKLFLAKIVTFHFNPAGEVKPAFTLGFGSVEDKPLLLPDDPVMVTADWQTTVPQTAQNYQIKITRDGIFAVLFFNSMLGTKVARFQVLFPGEDSFKLSLDPLFGAPHDGGGQVFASTPLWMMAGGCALLAVFAGAFVRRKNRRPAA